MSRAILEETPPLLPRVPRLARNRIPELLNQFEQLQVHFRATGACHGAGLFTPDGELLGHGEDVGRHNALDKAIGLAARSGHDLTRGGGLPVGTGRIRSRAQVPAPADRHNPLGLGTFRHELRHVQGRRRHPGGVRSTGPAQGLLGRRPPGVRWSVPGPFFPLTA